MMDKEVFKTTDGSVKVEKNRTNTNKKKEEPARKKTLKADEIIETAFSYQNSNFVSLEPGKGNDCAICGKHIAYNNRTICADCWEKNWRKILNELKKGAETNIIEIE